MTLSPRRRAPRALVSVLAILAVVAAALVLPGQAATAGPRAPLAIPGGAATVTTSVEYVSALDLSTPITELRATASTATPTDKFGLNIGYACGSASACTGVTVKIAPQQLDRFSGTYRFATYVGATPPSGATVSGTAAAGYTIALGNLAAGATGAFTVTFSWQGRGTSVAPQSFFTDGEVITNTVTIDAANAGATATASDTIVWRIDTKTPLVAFGTQGLARADTDYAYTLRMATDCLWYRTTANHGEPSKLCAASYTNTFQLPAGASFVSASPDGVYSAGTRTVTWTQSGTAAATGWGSVNGFGAARTVVVRFPDSLFTDDCVLTATASFATDVTYLDAQRKTASATTSHDVSSCTPFGSAAPVQKWSTVQQNPDIVWDSGVTNSWYIRVGNKGNVPGVAVMTDSGLDQIANVRVTEVSAPSGRIDYVLDNGATGTATGTFTVPDARKVASIEVTSPELAGPNKVASSQPLVTQWTVALRYAVVGDAPPEGWQRSNTASAVMTYPGTSLTSVSEGSATSTILIAPRPANFASSLAARLTGSGNPVAGVPVAYTLTGTTSSMEVTATTAPQYVFVAPVDWELVANSWSLPQTAPAGAAFTTRSVTIAGQVREALVVSWPAGTWGTNVSWPALSVRATPTASASAGGVGVAHGYVGEASHSFPGLSATWGGNSNAQRYVDGADLDGDSVLTEHFALDTASTTVGAASGLSTVKEICRVDASLPGGCEWLSDASQTVPVSPVATDITYRVSLRNTGNTALANVVAYDVLPHVGDTGISAGSASVARGSEFAESVSTVTGVSSNLSMTYSPSTNPCRSEVHQAGPVGCANTWSASSLGAVAIRAAVNGGLAPGASATFTYTAAVLGDPSAGSRACNSIATAATGVPVSEPGAVCAQIEASDLAVEVSVPPSIQLGRPTHVAVDVTNVAGTSTVPSVEVDLPAGVRIISVPSGSWSCSPSSGPVSGPTTLSCVRGTLLAGGASDRLELPAAVEIDGVGITARVSGPLYDAVPNNNTATLTVDAAPAITTGLVVTKSDGLAAIRPGGALTYTITVQNELVGEAITGAVVEEVVPRGVVIQSTQATPEGDTSYMRGGNLMVPLGTIAAGSTATVTITVVLQSTYTGTTLSNTANVTAPDPADSTRTLTGTATDVDQVGRITLEKSARMLAPGDATDPQPGDVIEYEFLVTNAGGAALTTVQLTDPKPGLSAFTYPEGWPGAAGELAAGESVRAIATYTLVAQDIDDGGVQNTASVEAEIDGGETVEATSSVDYALPAVGGLTLTKAGALAAATPHPGDEIEYDFEIGNTGNVTLTDVTISDPLAGLTAITYTWPDAAQPGVIPAGQTAAATASYPLTQTDIDRGTVANTATVTGIDSGRARFSATDSATVAILAVPKATIVKDGALRTSSDPTAGDTVDFSFEVRNTGNVALTGVSIADTLPGISALTYGSWPSRTGELAPGERVTATANYRLTQDDIDAGVLRNSAALAGTPVRGTAVSVAAHVDIALARTPALAVTKTAELLGDNGDGVGNPGERIRYGFTVRNTGNVTIRDAVVEDPMVQGIPTISSLAPGQSMQVFAAAYAVTVDDARAGRIDNTATVSAFAAGSGTTAAQPSSTMTPSAILPGSGLADTGSNGVAVWVGAGGLGALLLGILTVFIARRRRVIAAG